MDKIAIIAGQFHKQRIEKMLAAARHEAEQQELQISKELWVPGSYEVPLALQCVLKTGIYSGVAVLGIIERGETKHGLVMGQAIFPAIMKLQLEYECPVGIGIIGPEVTEEQMDVRLEPHGSAAICAIRAMLNLMQQNS